MTTVKNEVESSKVQRKTRRVLLGSLALVTTLWISCTIHLSRRLFLEDVVGEPPMQIDSITVVEPRKGTRLEDPQLLKAIAKLISKSEIWTPNCEADRVIQALGDSPQRGDSHWIILVAKTGNRRIGPIEIYLNEVQGRYEVLLNESHVILNDPLPGICVLTTVEEIEGIQPLLPHMHSVDR